MGISPASRIRRSTEYRRVYRHGFRHRSRWFTVFALGREEGDADRLGITASRKVGNAVTRNRCKRRIRELGWLLLSTNRRPALDLVVNAHRGLDRAPWARLREDFEHSVDHLRGRVASR